MGGPQAVREVRGEAVTRHAKCTPATVTPHQHDPTRAPRWRFADHKARIKGCPLRHDYDQDGKLRMVACTDLKGTLDSCVRCQR